MSHLPVVVGFGGVNPAGRSSFHHGYRRLVLDALPLAAQQRTLQSLAALMGVDDCMPEAERRQHILAHTLIRKIESAAFDVEQVAWNKRLHLEGGAGQFEFVTSAKQLPERVPEGWALRDIGGGKVAVTLDGGLDMLLPTHRKMDVSSAGQLPTGFDPSNYYNARNHPRGLQLSVFGASDALQSIGIDWDTVRASVHPDQISVYASSAMAQLDDAGFGGLLAARANGGRVSSKQLALGLADMPADFVSAYVLGNVGGTGPSLGACATFFYNLRQAVQDIRSGAVRVAVVGAAEAGIDPRVMDGYATMGALATDADLLKLDAGSARSEADYRRASRPFSSNCGFTIAEASQFVVLFDDALALELGAQVHAAVPEVFVNADGYKKSISSPGVGNYLTVAKATSAAGAIIGEHALKTRSFVQAHGTSTPQNRVSESHILNETAKAFGIERWPVAAIKAYLGHSIGAASGDQLVSSLGIWRDNILPGITTIDHIADDVQRSNLHLPMSHLELEKDSMDAAILNAKGFGGNNASVCLLSPQFTERLLRGRHGSRAWKGYCERREESVAQANAYDEAALRGELSVRYQFGEGVLESDDLDIQADSIGIAGWLKRVELPNTSPYTSWLASEDAQ
ncbi:beta-ketoacyl synthase [Spongiibacter marinus]|uniref:beta-ketoacyl synthase n=1 Tax=Spongiibacter marinus TaxID=354246 RepID=UPI0004235344|nr:beta-ketoacyl synthase [Spongiibacter marinus]